MPRCVVLSLGMGQTMVQGVSTALVDVHMEKSELEFFTETERGRLVWFGMMYFSVNAHRLYSQICWECISGWHTLYGGETVQM